MRKAAVRLVSSTRSQSSSLIRGARPSACTPALLTSTSTGPNACFERGEAGVGARRGRRCRRRARARRRRPPRSARRPPRRRRRRCGSARRPAQPSAASSRAIAAPMPRDAPVTSAQPVAFGLSSSPTRLPSRSVPPPQVKPPPKAASSTLRAVAQASVARAPRRAPAAAVAADVLPMRAMQSTTRLRVELEPLADRLEDARRWPGGRRTGRRRRASSAGRRRASRASPRRARRRRAEGRRGRPSRIRRRSRDGEMHSGAERVVTRSTTADRPRPPLGAEHDRARAVGEQHRGLRSSWSVTRLMRSAPTTSARSARPASICAAASDSAVRKPVHAAPTSIVPARSAPSSCATQRRGVRQPLVGGERGDEDEVERRPRRRAARVERPAAASMRPGQRLVRLGVAALADPGARVDPAVVDADAARRSRRWGRCVAGSAGADAAIAAAPRQRPARRGRRGRAGASSASQAPRPPAASAVSDLGGP